MRTRIEPIRDFLSTYLRATITNSPLFPRPAKLRDLLNTLGLSKTRVLVRRGRVVGSFDLELNAYIQQDGNHSQSTIPLGAVVDIVKQWDLPKPMGLAIRGSKRWSVNFKGEDVEAMKLLWPNEVTSRDVVKVSVDRHWYGLLAALLLAVMIVGGLSLLCWLSIKVLFGPSSKTVKPPAPTPQTLVEAQARYDANSSKKGAKILRIILFAMFAIFIPLQAGMQDAGNWFPQGASSVVAWLALPVMLLLCAVFVVRRIRKVPSSTPRSEQRARRLSWILIPFVLVYVLLSIQLLAPHLLFWAPAAAVKWTIYGLILGGIATGMGSAVIKGRRSTVKLGPGDVDYDAASEMAQKGKVKFRQMILLKESKKTNAFARLDGTVALTNGARERLSDLDRRSVIAHELGHLKHRHVPRLIFFSLCFWAVIFGIEMGISRSHLPIAVIDMSRALSSPVVFFPLLMIARSPFQRKAEFAADKFALETIGNFTDVAVSLAKVHLQNAAPHTYTKFDESIASHPSLVKRLNALRETAIQLGMIVPEDEIERILGTLTVAESFVETPADLPACAESHAPNAPVA